MSQVPQRKISFTAGQTFIDRALWCQGARVYKQLSDITYGLPTSIKVPAHGIPLGVVIAIWFENMNSKSFSSNTPYFATAIDANTLTLLDHNSVGIDQASIGSIYYIPPIETEDLTFVTQFRKTVSSPVLLEIRSDGVSPRFTLPGNGVIQTELKPEDTKALIGTNKIPISGIAQVEATNLSGQVFRPFDYIWEVFPEGTL